MKLNLNKKRIFIGIFILLLIIGLIVFFVFNKKDDTKKKEPVKEETKEEIYTKLLDYAAITAYLNNNSLPDDLYGFFYKEETVKNKEISNKVKIYMAIRNLISEKGEVDPNTEISFTEEEVSDKIKEIFGKKTSFKNESLEGETCSFSNFKYDKNSKKYVQKPEECVTSRNDSIYYKLISEESTDNERIIVARVGFLITAFDTASSRIKYYIYSDINKENLVFKDYGMDENVIAEKLNSYKFIFVREDTNNFYLDRVEIVR